MTEETTAKQSEPKGESATAVNALESATEQKPQDSSSNDSGNVEEDIKPESSKPEGKESKKEWYIDTITGLRAGKRESDARAKIMEEQNAVLLAALAAKNPTAEGKPEAAKPELTDAEINRIANERAVEIAAAKEFNKACNSIYDTGKSEFTDFDNAVENLKAVGALGQNANTAFLQALTEIPDSHKILHHLGNNPEEATRINSLPPLKMAIELAEIRNSLNAHKSKPLSTAPAPIKPVSAKGKADVDLSDPDLDMKSWVRAREKEKEMRTKNA